MHGKYDLDFIIVSIQIGGLRGINCYYREVMKFLNFVTNHKNYFQANRYKLYIQVLGIWCDKIVPLFQYKKKENLLSSLTQYTCCEISRKLSMFVIRLR